MSTNRHSHTSSAKAHPSNSQQPPLTFTFQNIGPITQADLALGDLTVIAGRNNTGKTYLVYTLYGFLKMSRLSPSFPLDMGPDFLKIEQIVTRLLHSGQVRHTIDPETFDCGRYTALNYLARHFSEEGIPTVFSNRPDAFKDASIQVKGPTLKPTPTKRREIALSSGGFLSIDYNGNDLVVSVDKVDQHPNHFELQHHLSLFLFEFLFGDFPSLPFILSAERFGISLFYRELDFTKNKLVDVLQRMGDDKGRRRVSPFLFIDNSTSRYALPIKDNIDYTRDIPDSRKARSQVYEDKLFDDIKEMMGGYYGSSEGDIRFISKARKGRRFNIPLHLASSSARGLSDLYFFLRHTARENQLLIIDEPESHLDTANQIQMARLLARFVRAGIKVLITTHSDYLIKEFNNLIMLERPFRNREVVAKNLGYDVGEFLPRNAVRAYVAEENTLRECSVDQFGMSMPVFDASIDNINDVANELASRIEEEDV